MRWKLALAQHPMYLIIREDTQCAERIPPWGAPSIELYIERIRQNLVAIQEYPQLKIGYEWSGIELELLLSDAPDVIQTMRSLAEQGRIRFYNGTYSQPHLQTLSSEANFRQFEYGQQVYQDLFGQQVLTYAHQESSVHDQVPQLLHVFGIPWAILPGFLTTLVWLDEGEMVFHGVVGPRFVHGHEFAAWQGLDGTTVPLYLRQPVPRQWTLKEHLVREAVIGPLSVPPIFIEMPDMVSIDEAWLAEREDIEHVLLDEALSERFAQVPPRSRVRLFSNWSYLEGIRAEELSRTNWQAELNVLRAEALNAMAFILVDRPPESTHEIWKTILITQHHDAYCFSAPELRDKSIQWLKQAADEGKRLMDRAADAIVSEVRTEGQDGQPIVVFNTVPHPVIGLANIEVDSEWMRLTDGEGVRLPCEVIPDEEGVNHLAFLAKMPGFGYATYWLHPGEKEGRLEEVKGPLEFENSYYRALIRSDGTFASIALKPDGEELLDPKVGSGNQLRATDSTEISLKHEGNEERMQRFVSDPPARGPDLYWEATGPASVCHSPLGITMMAQGHLGDHVEADVVLRLYHLLPRIDITWSFAFDAASIGTYFDDDSKLHVCWPLAFSGDVHHDIPFGVIETRDERPFFPTQWVDISDGEKGIAFFHRGTPIYWLKNRTLFNLLAWGEDTDAIGNRLGNNRWLKAFDQRLNGQHAIHHAVYVHRGDWRSADVIAAARGYHFSPLAYPTDAHAGKLGTKQSLLAFFDPGLASSTIMAKEDQVLCRIYASGGQSAKPDAELSGLKAEKLRSVTGEEIHFLKSFQIGELILNRSE